MKYRNAVLILAIAALLLVLGILFAPIWQTPAIYTGIVSSNAMAPLLLPTDTILVNKSAYVTSSPARGDIVLFLAPLATNLVPVGRIVGIPGDKISIRRA